MASEAERKQEESEKQQVPSRYQFYREVAPYFGLGIQLAIAVVAFYLFGNWLDERYDTKPWLGLTGVFLGTLGGFIKFFKTVSDLSKNKQGKL
ncbi:MAG: AtpZ/AtpI family protein [Ignavibacteriales bacterium]|nr:AtpZ/AtpI family protein [Ignavibacteriales bacterium]